MQVFFFFAVITLGNQNCTDPRDVGRSGLLCIAVTMWYWNGSSCEAMRYLGCGGNNNRYRTQAACEAKCRPRT